MNIEFNSSNTINGEYENNNSNSNFMQSNIIQYAKIISGLNNFKNAYDCFTENNHALSKTQKILNIGTELVKGTGKILIVTAVITGAISQVATKQGLIAPYEKLGVRHTCEFAYKLTSKAIDKISGIALSMGVKEYFFSDSKSKVQVNEKNISQNKTASRYGKRLKRIHKQINKR